MKPTCHHCGKLGLKSEMNETTEYSAPHFRPVIRFFHIACIQRRVQEQ